MPGYYVERSVRLGCCEKSPIEFTGDGVRASGLWRGIGESCEWNLKVSRVSEAITTNWTELGQLKVTSGSDLENITPDRAGRKGYPETDTTRENQNFVWADI